jgi:hypothetical protein
MSYRRRALRVAVRLAAMVALAYVVAYEPIVPFLPVCHEYTESGPVRRTLFGLMTDEFATTLDRQEYPYDTRRVGNMIFMTVYEWTASPWRPFEVVRDVVLAIVSRRHGIAIRDIARGQVNLPRFNYTYPTCEAVRGIAFEGGKWSREGPSPIWYDPANTPRPEGFRGGERMPNWRKGEPGLEPNVRLQVDLAMKIAFGIAMGYLAGVWRGRDRLDMLRCLSLGAAFGAFLCLVYFIGLISQPPFLR